MNKGINKKGFAVSGILYPILILTLFLIVQILSMMASRKAVLDKNKQQLLDSVNRSNKIYNVEELSILVTEQQKKIDQLVSENATLKGSVTSLQTNLASYTTKNALMSPDNKIKTSIMNVYDGLNTSKMFARNYNATPNEYKRASGAIYSEFKQTKVLGITGLGDFCTLITINPYGGTDDFSGGYPTQFALGNGIMMKRHSATTTTWGSWEKLH